MEEITKRFAELAEKYGPNVIEAVRTAVEVEVWSNVMAAILAFTFGITMLKGAYLLHKKDDWDEIRYLPVGLLILSGIIPIVAAIWVVIDPWTWTALMNPDLWIAKKIFRI